MPSIDEETVPKDEVATKDEIVVPKVEPPQDNSEAKKDEPKVPTPTPTPPPIEVPVEVVQEEKEVIVQPKEIIEKPKDEIKKDDSEQLQEETGQKLSLFSI